jgi:hypothetical protein
MRMTCQVPMPTKKQDEIVKFKDENRLIIINGRTNKKKLSG